MKVFVINNSSLVTCIYQDLPMHSASQPSPEFGVGISNPVYLNPKSSAEDWMASRKWALILQKLYWIYIPISLSTSSSSWW